MNLVGELNSKAPVRRCPAYPHAMWNKYGATLQDKHRTNNMFKGYNRTFGLFAAQAFDWHIIDRFISEEEKSGHTLFQAVKGNTDTENSASRLFLAKDLVILYFFKWYL
jgi:hypothetical protein